MGIDRLVGTSATQLQNWHERTVRLREQIEKVSMQPVVTGPTLDEAESSNLRLRECAGGLRNIEAKLTDVLKDQLLEDFRQHAAGPEQ